MDGVIVVQVNEKKKSCIQYEEEKKRALAGNTRFYKFDNIFSTDANYILRPKHGLAF